MTINNIPFTPNNCPIQVGMIIWLPDTNSDMLVLERFYNGYGPDDPLIRTVQGTFSGNDLANRFAMYYITQQVSAGILPAYIVDTANVRYQKLYDYTFKDDTVHLCAETYVNTSSGAKKICVYNPSDGKRYTITILQYPDISEVVLLDEDSNKIICKIDNIDWLYYMLGDAGYPIVNTSKEAASYVNEALAKIAKYWR